MPIALIQKSVADQKKEYSHSEQNNFLYAEVRVSITPNFRKMENEVFHLKKPLINKGR